MTTSVELNLIALQISKDLKKPGHLFVEYMYGKPRLYKRLDCGTKAITETKSAPAMKAYLLAFQDGVKIAQEAQDANIPIHNQ